MNANLKRGNPRNLIVEDVFVYDTEIEARKGERAAHNHFNEFLHQKEWFNITPGQISKWFVSLGAIKRE